MQSANSAAPSVSHDFFSQNPAFLCQVLYSVFGLPELNNCPLHMAGSKNSTNGGGGSVILSCVSASRTLTDKRCFCRKSQRMKSCEAGNTVMNVWFLTKIRPDNLAGNGRVYVSGTSIVWLLILFSFNFSRQTYS